MRFSEALVERQGLLCQFLGSRECDSAASEAVVSEYAVAIGQARICKGVTGISTYCLFEVFDSPVYLVLSSQVPVVSSFEVERIRLWILSLLSLESRGFSNSELDFQCFCYLLGDIALDGENVL